MSTDNNDNSVEVNEKEESHFNKTGGNLPVGKIVTTIKKVFPSLTAMNTYRDRFKRIKRKTNYAQDLKLTSHSVNKVCNIDGECDLLSTIFLSHTKVNTGFIPYAGRKSKKVRKISIRDVPQQLKDRLNIEHKFHNNSTYHEPFHNLNIELKVDGASKRVDSKDCSEYLYDYLMRPPSSNNENDCVLIAGDVGCGKSTYIANVAHKIIHYIGIGTPLTERPSHTTQHTGPYCAIRLIRQNQIQGNTSPSDLKCKSGKAICTHLTLLIRQGPFRAQPVVNAWSL